MTQVTNFSQQIQDYKNQLADFKKDMASDEKLDDLKRKTKGEQNKEKKEVAKAQGGATSHAPMSSERALIAALAIAMQDNMDQMSSSANSMQNQDANIDAQMAKLNALDQEKSALAGLSPKDAMEKGLELNVGITAANNANSELETSLNLSGQQLQFASSMNNTESGAAQWIINFLHKEQTKA